MITQPGAGSDGSFNGYACVEAAIPELDSQA